MWLQPRQSPLEMSPQVLSSVQKHADELPDYAMGIDMDEKAFLRDALNPGIRKPQIPLWFGWASREIQESNRPIDLDITTGLLRSTNQAMLHIRAGTAGGNQPVPAASVEFTLWYRSDNPQPPAATQPGGHEISRDARGQNQHFYLIGREIVGVYTSPGSAEEGERLANEALQLAAKHPDNLVTLDALNQAHTVLGLVALKRGELFSVKMHLMQSISDKQSAIMNSFGPKLELAAALLARGERQTVLEWINVPATTPAPPRRCTAATIWLPRDKPPRIGVSRFRRAA